MILWVVLTAMIAIAAVIVSAPFIRRGERRRAEETLDLAVYRDQLKEVDVEASQGLIDATQAEAARTEIKRRALAAQGGAAAGSDISAGQRSFAAIGVAGVVVIGAVALFALTADLGSRDDAADDAPQPAASASAASPPAPVAGRAAMPTAAGQAALAARPTTGSAGNLPPVDEMIQRIVKRLDANPKDLSGWRMLGWSYAGVERYDEAADAYAKAIELAPNVAELRSARADALVRAKGGATSPEAMALVAEAIRLDPHDIRGRYLAGLAREQAGDKAGALDAWRQIASDSDANDPVVLELKQKIMTLEGGAAPVAAAPAPAQADRGPSAEDVKRAESMSTTERSAMIRNMVDSLAARLEKSPRDADGWIKLIRSRAALNDQLRASEALGKALKTFEDEPAERDRISASARELGVNP
ncbi:MAG: c-type cytochrome biogenesis protein CcmI [Hyphomicrobiales bacterium]|nr:c-type cytochrome biogenesis protein CcmI [Hyphomicrobiales bacterium]